MMAIHEVKYILSGAHNMKVNTEYQARKVHRG